jgi:hypothetical protein
MDSILRLVRRVIPKWNMILPKNAALVINQELDAPAW